MKCGSWRNSERRPSGIPASGSWARISAEQVAATDGNGAGGHIEWQSPWRSACTSKRRSRGTKMIRDPIVADVRAIREQLSARFDFDIRQIVEDAQRRQASSQARVVSFKRPKQPLPPTGAAIPAPSDSKSNAAPAAER